MQKSLWIILALVAIGAPSAHADSFTYTYTSTECFGGVICGRFSYTTEAIAAVTSETTLPAADLTATSLSGLFGECSFSSVTLNEGGVGNQGAILLGVQCSSIGEHPDGYSPADYSTQGTYTATIGSIVDTLVVTPVQAMPEPSEAGFLLLGVGLVFVMRKRIGQSLPQAS